MSEEQHEEDFCSLFCGTIVISAKVLHGTMASGFTWTLILAVVG